MPDSLLVAVLGLLLVLLITASIVCRVLLRKAKNDAAKATLANALARTQSWWVMAAVLALAFLLGKVATLLLFAVLSFVCLREFIGLTPTHEADRVPLFAAFFCILPVQYWLMYIQWYGLYSIFIPVYAFLLLPCLAVFSGSTEDFLARCAKIQWGVMITVYCISHAPAMLTLPPLAGSAPGYDATLLVLYLLLVAQLSDVFQYVCGKLWGKRKLAPSVSPSKTVEGLVGGCGCAVLAGMLFSFITPFAVWQAALLSLAIVAGGAAGGLVLSAVKRDLGAKDWGNSIEGHGGFLDRMDSICFSAPLFFHLVRYFFTG